MITLVLALGACTAVPIPTGINDPHEADNRRNHAFNKRLSQIMPEGDGPGVPEEIAVPVANFADNVGLPGVVLNNLLQGEVGPAGQNAMRFVVNTTLGIGGLVDVGDMIGLTEIDTDFGETLHVWGMEEGAYLELPVLGPTTERDLLGRMVDMVIDPLKFVGTPAQMCYGTPLKLTDKVLSASRMGNTINQVMNDSADSYAQLRLIYLQNRRHDLGQGSGDIDPYADATAIDPYEVTQ